MSTYSELPETFRARLAELVPASLRERVLASFQEPKCVTARFNTLQACADDIWHAVEQLGLAPMRLPWFSDAFVVSSTNRSSLMDSKLYQDGSLYLQNASSLLPVVVLDPQPEEEVLDMAAAPGSKTLQICCAMGGRGRIAAVESVRHRFFKLKANLASQGATMVRCYQADAGKLWRKVPERFDRILLDAPCSSESRFRSDDPRSYAHWSRRKVEEMARKQKQLLHSAVHCLKPGGLLVYATCSFSPEENEAVITRALEVFGSALQVEKIELTRVSEGEGTGLDWSLVATCLPGLVSWNGDSFDPSLVHALRVVPNAIYDGFFVCQLRKLAPTD